MIRKQLQIKQTMCQLPQNLCLEVATYIIHYVRLSTVSMCYEGKHTGVFLRPVIEATIAHALKKSVPEEGTLS